MCLSLHFFVIWLLLSRVTFLKIGFLGLFRAYSIHAFKGPVSAAISFACNDIIKQKLKEYKMAREDAKEEIRLQEEEGVKDVLLTQTQVEAPVAATTTTEMTEKQT